MPYVTVANYRESTTAHLHRSLLESHGIKAMVANDSLDQLYPGIGRVRNDIELWVPADQLENARKILADYQSTGE